MVVLLCRKSRSIFRPTEQLPGPISIKKVQNYMKSILKLIMLSCVNYANILASLIQ